MSKRRILPKHMSSFYKNIFWAVISLLFLSAIFSGLFQAAADMPGKVSLNDLALKINAEEVSRITVQGEKLAIELKDGKKLESKKETEAGITQTLANFGVAPDQMKKVAIDVEEESGWWYWAGILIPTLLPVLLFGFIFWYMFRQAKGGANQAFNFGRANIRLSNFDKEKILFSDVAGLKESKEELVEVVDFLKNPKKFQDIGARIPRGVLLFGPPGTGKTLLARAVAGESNVPFFHISASEFVEMFVGVGASRIRDAFATARKASPSILFIDEIDAVGRQRGAGLGGGNDEREQTLNQILVELDGFDRETHVIILAATNRPDILDPALLRPGRFDRRVMLDLPDLSDRDQILKIHVKNKTLAEDVDLKKIAIRTPGFSGADLANVVNEAAIITARRDKKAISQAELYEAVEKVIMGPERKSRSITPHEREVTAYHEGGHALVAAALKDADPIHKITIVSRGMAGGYTMKLPLEERRLRTKSQFLADIAMSLGGYAAESALYGDISTGASSDLRSASEMARHMVVKYGMSDLGPIAFGKTEELLFLGREIAHEKNYSEKTAEKIDAEISKIIHEQLTKASHVLKEHRKALDAVAHALLEKETLEQEEFYELLKPFKIKQS